MENKKFTLPHDAEGQEIPLDTSKMYDCNGKPVYITRWSITTCLDTIFTEKNIWLAVDQDRLTKDPALLYLTPPDNNWDKLLKDLDNAAKGGDNAECLYANSIDCQYCKFGDSNSNLECSYLAYSDIASRIRKLVKKKVINNVPK